MDILITGSRDSGKTTLARKLAASLTDCGGVYTEAGFERGRKSVYYAVNATNGEKRHLLDLSPNGPRPDAAGFKFANAALASADGCKVLLIDEFGPLEAGGAGFMPTLRKIMLTHRGQKIISTRKALLLTAIDLFHLKNFELIDMDVTGTDDAARKVTCLLK